MSSTDDVITRRTVFVTVAGAACTLLVPPGKADDALPLRGPYRIEDWGKTGLTPSKARVLARVPAIAMPDIASYWPHTTRPVRGPARVCQAHHRSARLHSRLPRRADRARDERPRHVRSLDRERYRPQGTLRGRGRGSHNRAQRVRLGKPYHFGPPDFRGLR